MYLSMKKAAIITVFSALTLTIVHSNDQCDCGLINVQSRISHGSNANPHKYPWVAYLRPYIGGINAVCTGSLIDNRTILTAAHCVEDLDGTIIDPSQILVFLGIKTTENAYGNMALSVETILVHPQRNIIYKENDVALLRLEDPVKFSKNIQPACLPMDRQESALNKMKVAGFGGLSPKEMATDLQEADIDFLNDDKCYAKVSRFAASKGEPVGKFPKTILCGQGNGTTMVCGGDSGGPLMHQNKEGRMVIAGLSQFILKSCGEDEDVPDFYGNVGLFTDFIKQHASGACFIPLF